MCPGKNEKTTRDDIDIQRSKKMKYGVNITTISKKFLKGFNLV